MVKLSILFSLLIFLLIHKGNSQSILINALPLEYNPSFAGSGGPARLSYGIYTRTYQREWNTLIFSGRKVTAFDGNNGNQTTNFIQKTTRMHHGLSYDQFFSKLHCGLGFTLDYSSVAGNYSSLSPDSTAYPKFYNSNNFIAGLAISPKFSINGRYTIAPSIQGLFINSNGHTFGYKDQASKFKLKAGILFNTKKLILGYTIVTINKSEYIPNTKFYKLAFNSNIQLGYTFQKRDDSKFSFNPLFIFQYDHAVFYKYENIADLEPFPIIVNLNFRYRYFLAGYGFATSRTGEGIMVGYQTKKIKIMYVFYPYSYNNGSFEGQLSFRYIFNSKSENKLPATTY